MHDIQEWYYRFCRVEHILYIFYDAFCHSRWHLFKARCNRFKNHLLLYILHRITLDNRYQEFELLYVRNLPYHLGILLLSQLYKRSTNSSPHSSDSPRDTISKKSAIGSTLNAHGPTHILIMENPISRSFGVHWNAC